MTMRTTTGTDILLQGMTDGTEIGRIIKRAGRSRTGQTIATPKAERSKTVTERGRDPHLTKGKRRTGIFDLTGTVQKGPNALMRAETAEKETATAALTSGEKEKMGMTGKRSATEWQQQRMMVMMPRPEIEGRRGNSKRMIPKPRMIMTNTERRKNMRVGEKEEEKNIMAIQNRTSLGQTMAVLPPLSM